LFPDVTMISINVTHFREQAHVALSIFDQPRHIFRQKKTTQKGGFYTDYLNDLSDRKHP